MHEMLQNYLIVMKATAIVFMTFAPAIVIPCLLSLATDKQRIERSR